MGASLVISSLVSAIVSSLCTLLLLSATSRQSVGGLIEATLAAPQPQNIQASGITVVDADGRAKLILGALPDKGFGVGLYGTAGQASAVLEMSSGEPSIRLDSGGKTSFVGLTGRELRLDGGIGGVPSSIKLDAGDPRSGPSIMLGGAPKSASTIPSRISMEIDDSDSPRIAV